MKVLEAYLGSRLLSVGGSKRILLRIANVRADHSE